MLNIFSVDNFRPTAMNNGIKVRGLQPIILSGSKRKALLENVIRPMAKAAEASPHRQRLIAWDVMNEPEWAMMGSSKYGDPDFECDPDYQCLTHDQMESFLGEVITILRAESKALITVGGAAIKWAKAWSKLNLDFYQFHTYDWVDEWFPYTKSPAQYGITDKPVVMGEYPVNGLTNAPVKSLLPSYLGSGYAGALAWAVTDQAFDWNAGKGDIKAFAEENACKTKY
jgi:hypothetical protein